jgi:glycylpeptide N-tetradecanoyltransferase
MSEEEDKAELHKFWSEQPILRPDDDSAFDGYIDPKIPVTAPPETPVSLPAGFTWSVIDITDDAQLQEVYNFLAAFYVQDDEGRLRFLLSAPLLQWALTPPGGIPDWIIGVRARTGALAGFISAVPVQIRLNTDIQPWAAVNFLCVHRKLRTKNMASVLIAEIARRVRQSHIYRAVFSGKGVPSRPICDSLFHQRPLNLKRVSDSGFYPIDPKRSSVAQKRFALPQLVHGNCRPMTPDDIPAVTELFRETSTNFDFDIDFNETFVGHQLLPRKDVLYSYVIPGPAGPQAFFSFYIMNWKNIEPTATTRSELRVAYLWYSAVRGCDLGTVVGDLLHKAVSDAHADLATALGVAGGRDALIANRFEAGMTPLHFYSYNYAVPKIEDTKLRFMFV